MNDHPVKLKEALYSECLHYVKGRLQTAELAMKHAQESANEEGKSSAGDKYETGRAMMQLERDKAAQQVEEALKLKRVLATIRTDSVHSIVSLGSILISDVVNFYIAISAGKFIVDNREFIAIASNAPIASILLNLKAGDTFYFQGKEHTVRQVL